MERALGAALRDYPSVLGYLVADANGLLITASGDLKDKGVLSGRFTALMRKAEEKAAYSNPPEATSSAKVGGHLVVEASGGKQVILKKVGEFTIALVLPGPAAASA